MAVKCYPYISYNTIKISSDDLQTDATVGKRANRT